MGCQSSVASHLSSSASSILRSCQSNTLKARLHSTAGDAKGVAAILCIEKKQILSHIIYTKIFIFLIVPAVLGIVKEG